MHSLAKAHASHLMGFFYRTIRMVDHGIKPCYIFDGKPPELKGGVVSLVRCYSAGYAVYEFSAEK